MNIDWQHFTPGSSLAGGALIGFAAGLFALGDGRIAGIAGILGGARQALAARLRRQTLPGGSAVRIAFLAGLLAAPWAWRLFAPLPAARLDVGPPALLAAGLLVGVGVRLGQGCTSGHGVCGLARRSPRSAVNVLAFMAAGVATVFLLRHVWGPA